MADSSNENNKNLIDPEVPGAVGSRNSPYREGRNEYEESKLIIEDEINHILNHVETKLTPEALEKLQVGGNVKEVLHTYFNQTFHNMYNRYLVTVEDELSKKFRDMVDREESKGLNDYNPTQVADLLDQLGGLENFNSSEVEKSIVNIYGNLQGHLQTGLTDLQRKTEQILLGKSDIGSMVRSDYSYALVKCQFVNNKMKPETVQDVNLVINVLESELLSPLFHFQTATEGIIKEVISDHILAKVDQEIASLNTKVAEGGQGMSESEQVFEKIKRLEGHVDFKNEADSPQYSYVAKEFFATLEGIGSDFIKDENYDPLNIRENLQRFVDEGNLRTKGFNAAVNALTNILDERQLGYQHIENFKNGRKVMISEYADRSPLDLPDEKYSISLMYYDDEQLKAMRTSYSQQMSEFMTQVQKLWEVFDKVAKNERRNRRQTGDQVLNFQEVSAMYTGTGADFSFTPQKQSFFGKLFGIKPAAPSIPEVPEVPEESTGTKHWDEVVFIQPEKSEREKLNETFVQQRVFMNRKIKLLRKRLDEAFGSNFTDERLIITQRLDFLEASLDEYSKKFNPFNVRAGLFVELSMSTIVKKETTLKAMSDVLSLFLDSIAKGFLDAAGANWRANTEGGQSTQTGFNVMPEAVEEKV